MQLYFQIMREQSNLQQDRSDFLKAKPRESINIQGDPDMKTEWDKFSWGAAEWRYDLMRRNENIAE